MNRGRYDEINKPTDTTELRLFDEAMKIVRGLDSPDEHGAWETGCEFDRKGRGSSVNVDLYGVARWRRRVYAVVQVRQFQRRSARRYPVIRKNYFLIGRNESGSLFAHPVEASVVRGACRRADADHTTPVFAAMASVWGCTEHQLDTIVRNGDVALLPEHLPRNAEVVEVSPEPVAIVDSHVCLASAYAEANGRVYVRDAHVYHEKGQHPSASTAGWARLMVGRRARTWDFAAATAD